MSDFDIRSETLGHAPRTVLETHQYGELTVTKGLVHTRYGTVDVYARYNANGGWDSSRFCMAYEGRIYRGWASRYHQPRYLVTLATRFAKQVTEQEGRP